MDVFCVIHVCSCSILDILSIAIHVATKEGLFVTEWEQGETYVETTLESAFNFTPL